MKSAWHLRLKPQRRPIWKKDIPITQIDDEVKVVGEDRLQSNLKGHFSTLINDLLVSNILTQNFIIGVHLHGKSCTKIVHFLSHHEISELSLKMLK
jgi:hypothetical protein